MRKFTVFTVILTLVIVVIAAQVVADRYGSSLDLAFLTGENEVTGTTTAPLPDSLNLSANVLGADETAQIGLDSSALPPTEFGDGLDVPIGASDTVDAVETEGTETIDSPVLVDSSEVIPTEITGDADDFENTNFEPAILNVYLNQDHLKSAGFNNAVIATEAFDGFLYKTIYVQDLKDLKIFKNVVNSADSTLCKVYIIDVGPMSTPKDVYDTLKTRGAEGLDIEINETNTFGDGSFYMNDSRRQNVAFLTVRFGNLIYGFSYPKEYHPQVQNLIKLLDMEF
ncbi:MAG: hypothetical protein WC651_02330 [Candidatus Gracilibacteria bacterium]|jgi:hypothetical protein